MTDPVTRLNAALEGRYTIERELGQGGMATVYLAEDLKHQRRVALKVLKPELAAVVGAERFLGEIKTTANLQHPHILPLFDSGEADGFLFYVMPYVEGESLREKIDREHQLPVDEAVRIATDMAEALGYAHRQSVIHRDIKPGNVLIHDGQPVISDFGIALAVGVAGGGRLTETGLSLGTPHYMSPEQATGDQTVARATDIYALGAVLYEMLVGEPPYTGTTAQAVLGRIIAGELASATKERASVPPNVDAAIRKALEKLPADRFTDADDFANALADPAFRHGEAAATPVASRRPSWQAAALVGVGVLLGMVGMAIWPSGLEETAPVGVMRFEILPPEDAPLSFQGSLPDLAISPDGRQIVYKGPNPSGTLPQFHLRAIDQLVGAPLRGGEGGLGPFFSPDGAWVGFTDLSTSQILQKVSTFGGPPVTLTESPNNIFGASWGTDDQIIFGTDGAGLFRVSGGGGEPEALTTLDADEGELRHLWPSIIEGREAVVFVIHGTGELAEGQLAVVDLGTGEVKRVGVVGWSPRYVSTGHLVYAVTDGSIRAVPFDDASLEVTGSPVPLVEGVTVKASGAADFGVADNGRLIYARGAATGIGPGWELVWVDREGREEPLPMPAQSYDVPKVSPDGRRIAVDIVRDAARDIWVYDAATGAGLRLTRDDEVNRVPMWTPDGQRILFSSTKDAPRPESFTGTVWYGNIYSVLADGSSEAERVTTTEENQGLTGISPDGQTLVYSRVIDNAAHWEVMALPADGSADASALVPGLFRQGSGTISPDGRWLAYRSDESGQFEIYVEPFPGPGAKIPVSIGGGTQPAWSRDGGELFYRDNAGMMVAAAISDDATPPVGDRTPLFQAAPYRMGAGFRQYHVAPDGRFLMQRRPGVASGVGGQAPQITVVLNWFEELRERVPN
jgi:serine/threonine-protein kinase